ncbi:MAG: response regulator transcription factor [Myxococcales bacterium]|nr:response regulator transcription factor [Myxococcales bacterium]MCB9644305.1 response regulator transcription factor [Myxococcales bacterium]
MADKAAKKKFRVVLVDDHTLVREALASVLDNEKDIQVVALGGSGAEAQALVEKHKPDVLVMDIELPDQNGLVVGRDLLLENPKLNVIFLTMHHHEEYALRGLRAGAQGYLLKNSSSQELVDSVRSVASGGTYITREISDRIARHVARNGGQHAFTQLSEREFQVLRGLAMGKSCKELAEEFALSVKTIYTYRTRLLEKLDLKNDIDLLRYVLRHNLLAGEDEPMPLTSAE